MSKLHQVRLLARPGVTDTGYRWHTSSGHGEFPPRAVAAPARAGRRVASVALAAIALLAATVLSALPAFASGSSAAAAADSTPPPAHALGTGEPAAAGTGVAAYFHPNGIQANVFYAGANGQTYNWYWTGSAWTNSALGTGEPAAARTGVAAYVHPNGIQANVFYAGANGQIYNWYWTGSAWTNGPL